MPRMHTRTAIIALLVAATSACGGGSSGGNPTGPSASTPAPTTPAAVTWTLSGTVTSAGGGGISGATVSIGDGPNIGKSTTTNASGVYSLAGLTQSGFTVTFSAPGFVSTPRGVSLASNVTLSPALLPSELFTRSGFGNTVFDMPTYITRIRIQGTWNRTSNSNFIVSIGGRSVLNEILRDSINYDGIALTTGGVVSITSSGSIAWTFTEVR